MAFEAFLKQEQGARPRRSWRAITLACSLMLHGAGAVAATAQSFWVVEELHPPTARVSFSVRLPAAPPPPPAAAARAPEAPRPVKQQPRVATRKIVPAPALVPAITQPPAAAPPPAPEAAPGPEDRAGVASGPASASGGVPGGAPAVVAPAPRPVEQPSVMLPPNVGAGRRTSDINDPRFRPSLPRALKEVGAVVWGLYRICVDVDGRVKDVKVLRSADPIVDPAWIAVVKRWEYRPYEVNGRAVPFCHAARIEVQSGL